MFWKNLKKVLVFVTIFGLFFSHFPNNFVSDSLGLQIPSASAAIGDARLLYSNTSDLLPRSRYYTTSNNAYDAALSTTAASAANSFVVSKESTTEDGGIMVTESSTGKMDIFCRTGSTWTRDISNVTVGPNGATRRFDVEYEKTSGIPMVLYSTNASGANELSYYRKTSSGCGAGKWTGPTALDPTRITGSVLWIGLAAQQTSGSNVLGAAFSDTSGSAGGTLESMIWNGSSWGSESPAASAQGWSDSSIKLNGSAGANNIKVFDLTFETLSGKLMVVWGTSTGNIGTNGWRYATCAAGTLPCTWSSVQSPNGLYDDAANIACASDPTSNSIAVIGEGNSGPRVSAWSWDGSGVTATANGADSNVPQVEAGNSHVDIDWVINGTQKMAVGVFSSTSGAKYIFYNAGMTSWRYGSSNPAVPGAPSTLVKSVQVSTDPSDRTKLLATFTDANSNLWSKQLNYNGANGGWDLTISTWSDADGGAALETAVNSVSSQPFWFDWMRFNAVPQATLNIAATAGSKVATLNTGDTAKYVTNPACTAESGCAAFKFTASGGSVTVTSIKITQNGTVPANTYLSNPTLVYDTDANFSNGVFDNFGSLSTFAADQSATFTNAGVTIPSGSSYYFYLRFDVINGSNYPTGGNTINFQIASTDDVASNGSNVSSMPVTLNGTTSIKPIITSYTNSTETGLNYSPSCTNCGARIGPGSGFRQTITINGYGFGADPGLGSRSSATNKVEVIGTSTIAVKDDGSTNTNVSAWGPNSITIRTDSNITGNTDTDWGTNYGGALRLTVGGQTSTSNLNFYIFPQVVSLTAPTAMADAAREYNAADSDGIVTLNGTRFGSSSTGGWVRIFGCDSSTCSSPSGTVNVNSWSSTAIAVQVPPVIADNIYTGSVIMQQGTGTTNKSHTYTTNGFRVLPRITSLSPASSVTGAAITLNGDHLCQNAGTCPSAFDANNKVTFSSGQDTSSFTSWSNTAIATVIPLNAVTGNVFVLSNAYSSNNQTFTTLSATPSDPTNLAQFSNLSLPTPISIGGAASSTNTYLAMTMQAAFAGGTLYPQIEYDPVGTAFSCTGTSACAQAVEGTGQAGPGPINCSLVSGACAIAIAPTDNVYHWQARVRHNRSGVDYYSNWVSFGANAESATDFQIDKTAPTITFVGSNTCTDALTSMSSNGATISWSLNENGRGQVEYSKNSDLSGSVTSPLDSSGLYHSYSINNLDSNATYYFRIKSYDTVGNQTIRPNASPYCAFATSNVTQPAKTVKFFVNSAPGLLSAAVATSSNFSVYVPENSVSVKSAFIEIKGFSNYSGTNNVAVSVNGQATSTYSVATNGNSFRILYPVTAVNLNFDPISNNLYLLPSANLNISSANLVLTYSFAP